MTESNNPSALRSQKEITEALLSLMKEYPYNEISVKQIILEAKQQVKLRRNRDEKGAPPNTPHTPSYTQMLPKGLSLPAHQSGEGKKS